MTHLSDTAIFLILDEISKGISILLIAAGLFLFIADLLTRFDKMFRFAGLLIVVLSICASFNTWVQPGLRSAEVNLFWFKGLHVIGCLIVWYCIFYTFHLTRHKNRILFILPGVLLGINSAVLMTDLVFLIKDGTMQVTMIYTTLMPVSMLLYTLLVAALLIRSIKFADHGMKRVLWFHLFGLFFLGIFVTADVIDATLRGPQKPPNFVLYGIFIFTGMIAASFITRLVQLIEDRRRAYERLEEAFRELEAVSALKTLGESVSIINHEISNQMFLIKHALGKVSGSTVPSEFMRTADLIRSRIDRLQSFSRDILTLPRAGLVTKREAMSLCTLITGTLATEFPDRQESLRVQIPSADPMVLGERDKLERVLMNIVKNSFEAGAGQIDITIACGWGHAAVRIQDNGEGCAPHNTDQLFRSFSTSKGINRGTGLGLAICKAIVEAHSGAISAYSLNNGDGTRHGLELDIVLPLSVDPGEEGTRVISTAFLIEPDMTRAEHLMRIFRNVHIAVRRFSSADDLFGAADQQIITVNAPVFIDGSENISRMISRFEGSTPYEIRFDGAAAFVRTPALPHQWVQITEYALTAMTWNHENRENIPKHTPEPAECTL